MPVAVIARVRVCVCAEEIKEGNGEMMREREGDKGREKDGERPSEREGWRGEIGYCRFE